MRIFLIFSLLFSAAICASLVHQPIKQQDVGPVKLNGLPENVEVHTACMGSVNNVPSGGNISSLNYPDRYPNIFCTYLIDLRSSAESVLLKFMDLDTDYEQDYVKVFDGPSYVFDSLLLQTSGPYIPEPVLSSTGQMLITFDPTGLNLRPFRGFSVAFSNGGCGGTFTKMIGNISSPNYPDDYFDFRDCQYKIDLRSSGATSVNLTFLDFEVQTDIDFVYVYEGLSTTGVLLLAATGNTIPRSVESRQGAMLVRFKTAKSLSRFRGFQATYEGF